jgi:acyl-ACP thioesterase
MNHHVNNVKYVRWMLEVKKTNFLQCQNIAALTFYFWYNILSPSHRGCRLTFSV